MVKQGVSFDEVYDKFAVRIIYKSDLENEKFLSLENIFHSYRSFYTKSNSIT